MKRAQFIKLVGAGTVACACGQLVSCTSKSTDPAPASLDFTLDLTASANAALNSDGGSVSTQGIIVVRIAAGDFVALSQACTHQGTPVAFQRAANNFLCNNHGSTFSLTGAVTKGPAASPLRKFNTELNGNSLRVFS
ncbi:MAG: ubiquinol-cytochrome c reductase iron-sulfur subunit [Flammeovirgaceae bacterium]